MTMYVFPMMDRKSGEVILIYRNKRKGEAAGWLDAEVYKFHDTLLQTATHYGAFELNTEYLSTLEIPKRKDERIVAHAVQFYQRHSKSIDGSTVLRAKGTLPEYRAARRKFLLDKTPSAG